MALEYSPKKKWVTFLLCLFLFPFGAHAFYTQRYARGFFFLGSIVGVTSYYYYIIYKIKGMLSSIPFLKEMSALSILSTVIIGGGVLQFVPFLGFIKYLTTYLIYIFLLAIVIWIYDLFVICCGRFRDGDYKRVVSERKKNKIKAQAQVKVSE